MTHNAARYKRGCRCATCREAKSLETRALRAAATEAAKAGALVSEPRRHGTRYAYECLGCRCGKCKHRQIVRHQTDEARRKRLAVTS